MDEFTSFAAAALSVLVPNSVAHLYKKWKASKEQSTAKPFSEPEHVAARARVSTALKAAGVHVERYTAGN